MKGPELEFELDDELMPDDEEENVLVKLAPMLSDELTIDTPDKLLGGGLTCDRLRIEMTSRHAFTTRSYFSSSSRLHVADSGPM